MEHNVYRNPGAFGLEIVAEHEFSTGSYQFDTRVVWKDKEGRLFTARDSGCSCPSPFESYSLDGKYPLDRLTSFDFLIEEDIKEAKSYDSMQGWDEFKSKVMAALEALRQA